MWETVCGTRPCCSIPCVLGICLTLPSCCVLPDPLDNMSPLPDQLPDAVQFPVPPDRKSQHQLSSSCHNSHPSSAKSSLPNSSPKCHNLPDPPQLLQSSWSHTVKPLWFVPSQLLCPLPLKAVVQIQSPWSALQVQKFTIIAHRFFTGYNYLGIFQKKNPAVVDLQQ